MLIPTGQSTLREKSKLGWKSLSQSCSSAAHEPGQRKALDLASALHDAPEENHPTHRTAQALG